MQVLGLADHYTLDGLKHVCENVLMHRLAPLRRFSPGAGLLRNRLFHR